MNLTALPAFTDHRIRMLADDHQALVVDPVVASPVLAALQARRFMLAVILMTRRRPPARDSVDALYSTERQAPHKRLAGAPNASFALPLPCSVCASGSGVH